MSSSAACLPPRRGCAGCSAAPAAAVHASALTAAGRVVFTFAEPCGKSSVGIRQGASVARGGGARRRERTAGRTMNVLESQVITRVSDLRPVLAILRAAMAGGDRTAFLPTAAREAADFLSADACEVWLDDEGPALAAVYRAPEAAVRSPEARTLRRAMAGDVVREGPWLCVPIPGADRPMGVLTAMGPAAWAEDEAERAQLVAGLVGLVQSAAGSEHFDAEARDQFLALLGHDLRSPLANVRVGAQLARRNLDAGDIESVREALAIIENQSGRLLGRLEALLEAIAAAGHRLIRLEPLDLAAMADTIVAPYGLAAEELGTGTAFTVEHPPHPLLGRGDASQVGQVLEQLVDNAAKYAAGGHVTITVHPAGSSVRVDVCDDGPGIRPEDVDRVFAPFGRGRSGGDKQGYGLGLYLARNIISAHGGRLWIARTSRSGTCMAFTLPAVASEGP
jgi:signal transduction histidine kinase